VNSDARGQQNGITEVRGGEWVLRGNGVHTERKDDEGVLSAHLGRGSTWCGEERGQGGGSGV
jgi:hypothetical protein